jgi:hypothetical protein
VTRLDGKIVSYCQRLLRLFAALVLGLFVLQAAGVSAAGARICVEQCQDDGPDGQCAPDCEDCVCCAHTRGTVTALAAVLLPAEGRTRRILRAEASPPESEAKDILHIPKSR